MINRIIFGFFLTLLLGCNTSKIDIKVSCGDSCKAKKEQKRNGLISRFPFKGLSSTDIISAKFSGDGSSIVILAESNSPNRARLLIYNISGNSFELIASNINPLVEVNIEETGRYIAYHTYEGFTVIYDLLDKSKHQLDNFLTKLGGHCLFNTSQGQVICQNDLDYQYSDYYKKYDYKVFSLETFDQIGDPILVNDPIFALKQNVQVDPGGQYYFSTDVTSFLGTGPYNFDQYDKDTGVKTTIYTTVTGRAIRDVTLTDNGKIVYRTTETTGGEFELRAMNVDGSGNGVISPAMVLDGDVKSFKVSPDETKVVYLADQDTDGVDELYVVDMDGSNPLNLSGVIVSGGNVVEFDITDDGAVIFMADKDTDEVFELYSVLLNGSSLKKISPYLVNGGDVQSFKVLGERVLYHADQEINNKFELYEVLSHGGSKFKASHDYSGNKTLWNYQISPQGNYLYIMDSEDSDIQCLFLNGEKLDLPEFNSHSISHIVPTSSGSGFAYQDIQYLDGRNIYYYNLESKTHEKLFDLPSANIKIKEMEFIDNDTKLIFYANTKNPLYYEIFVFDIFTKELIQINEIDNIEYQNGRFSVAVDHKLKKIIFLERLSVGNPRYTLQVTDFRGENKVQLSNPAPAYFAGYPHHFLHLPEQGQVLYLANENYAQVREVFRVDLDGTNRLKISGNHGTTGSANSASELTVIDDKMYYIAQGEVQRVDLDGSSHVTLSSTTNSISKYLVSPDEKGFAFISDELTSGQNEVFYQDMNGSNQVKLNTSMVLNGDVIGNSVFFSPDSQSIYYTADQLVDGENRIFLSPRSGNSNEIVLLPKVYSKSSLSISSTNYYKFLTDDWILLTDNNEGKLQYNIFLVNLKTQQELHLNTLGGSYVSLNLESIGVLNQGLVIPLKNESLSQLIFLDFTNLQKTILNSYRGENKNFQHSFYTFSNQDKALLGLSMFSDEIFMYEFNPEIMKK